MKNCEITIRPGSLPKVKTNPALFNNILEYTNYNVEDALALYGMTLTEEFIALGIKNPSLQELLTFVEVDNSFEASDMTKEDNKLLLNLSVNENEILNFKDKLIESLTVSGVFGINIDNLTNSNLFTESDIEYLMQTSQLDDIKKLYYKLKSSDNIEINTIVTPFVINANRNPLEKLNPDIFLTNIYNNYINVNTEKDVLDIANSIQDEVVLNNPSIILDIIDETKNKQSLVAYETDEYTGEVSKKTTNNIYTILEQTLDVEQDFRSLLSQLEFLKAQPIEVFAENLQDLQRYIFNIEKQSAELGLDLSDFSEILSSRNFNQIQSFIDSLFNFVIDVQNRDSESLQETILEYSNNYNNFFQISPEFKNRIVERIDEEGVFLNLETNESEESLFNTNSIIKYQDNIYQKITDNKSLEQLYEIIYNNSNLLPLNAYNVPLTNNNIDAILIDIDNYIENIAKNLLSEDSEIEIIKKIVAYKIILGINTENTVKEQLNNSYLQDNWINPEKFLSDFNKQILKNPSLLKDIFFFSNRGLEAKINMGDYTIVELQNNLSENMFEDLQQYTLLSGNESLSSLLPQYEVTEIVNEDILRNYYANNLSELNEESTPYQMYGETAIIQNIVKPFTKIKNQLYEQLEPNIYQLVPVSKRYKNYNLQRPELGITNPSQYVQIKNEQEVKKISVTKTITNIENSEIEFC